MVMGRGKAGFFKGGHRVGGGENKSENLRAVAEGSFVIEVQPPMSVPATNI